MAIQRKSFMYGVITGLVTYAIMKWYCERRTRRKRNITFDGNEDCFLFNPTDPNNHCNYLIKGCYNQSFCCTYNYKKFLALIEETRIHLDICVYVITSDEVAHVLYGLLRRGVYIRIIMDKQMSQSLNSKLTFFIKNHIPVKLIEGKDGQLMHNKFVIIDRQKLITGSFNWTESGFKGNFENGIVTHNKYILLKYCTYYDSIWNAQGKHSLVYSNVP